MPYTVEKIPSSKFRSYIPFWCLGINLIIVLLLIGSNSLAKTLTDTKVTTQKVEDKNQVKLKPISIEPSVFGALRIDAAAIIKDNSWLTYEIQFLNSQGEVVASALKPAWRESGTWREDGESGRWSERDLKGGIDVRLGKDKQAQTLTPVIEVLEYTDTQGVPIADNQNISFNVKIIQGAIDTRYLWAGLVGTGFMTLFSFFTAGSNGNTVINKSIDDSDLGARETFGNKNKLVKATVLVVADETTFSTLTINLWLNDGYGEQCCHLKELVAINIYRNEDREFVRGYGKKDFYFLFPKKDSYNFYLEITPDSPVEKTTLLVKKNVTTLDKKIKVNRINYSEV